MSTGRPEPSRQAVHEFVQLLAGWVPDEELAGVRRMLARGQPATAGAAAVALVAEHGVPLLAGDIEVARSLTAEPDALDDVRPVGQYPQIPFWFSACDADDWLEPDHPDLVIAEAAQARGEHIAGVWRTWRFPVDDVGEPGPDDPEDPDWAYRVYVVQVPDGAAAPAIAGELQYALTGHGAAGVEVLGLDTVPRPYQAAAMEGSALLWAAGDDEGTLPGGERPLFKIARVFDFAKADTGSGPVRTP
jgi:hypothetical protein